MIRQHAGAALVAAGVVTAALLNGAFEPTAYAVGSIVLWAAVLAGLVSRALPAGRVGIPAAVAGLCLAGVVLLSGASVAWASDQGRAFEEAVRASAYLGLFTLVVCTATPRGRGQWVAGLTVGIAIVAVLAVTSRLHPGLLDDGSLKELIPGSGARLSYPIGYWNGLAALLAVGLILLAHSGVRAPERWLRSAAVGAMPIAMIGIWYTSSRGALVAAVAGMVVLVAAAGNRTRQLTIALIGAAGGGLAILATSRFHALGDGLGDATARAQGNWASLILVALVILTGALAWFAEGRELKLRASRRVWVGIAVVAAVGLVGAVIVAHPAQRFSEFKKQPPPSTRGALVPVRGNDFSGSGRWQLWGEAVDAFESAPVAGVGAGGYQEWWAQHSPFFLFVRSAHSMPLQQLAELGVLGGLLMLGFIAAVGVAAWRRLRGSGDRGGDSDEDGDADGDAGVLVAVIVAGGVTALIDWGWTIPGVFGPIVAAAGLLTAWSPERGPQRDSYALGLGTVAIAWVAMVAAGLVLLTEIKLDQSRSAARRGQIGEAMDRADEAHTVQPWSAEPYIQLALLEETRGDYGRALMRLKQAELRDSGDWRLPLIEARVQDERGNRDAGLLAFDRARALNPTSPLLGGSG